ncbi:hypothetical protein [Nitrosomonas mobilis]|uniref:Uncharacterized protein n=1 Tax=Nitrosomonas mobilis TaxID=51642 RepID=A0A1G5SCZ8_9PROT|nr:hypothetical protein [Nitrosomonas mobilis]SCZ85063.1 hypothetical protein NSMM_330083 [Nitrosomonas mobilis]
MNTNQNLSLPPAEAEAFVESPQETELAARPRVFGSLACHVCKGGDSP